MFVFHCMYECYLLHWKHKSTGCESDNLSSIGKITKLERKHENEIAYEFFLVSSFAWGWSLVWFDFAKCGKKKNQATSCWLRRHYVLFGPIAMRFRKKARTPIFVLFFFSTFCSLHINFQISSRFTLPHQIQFDSFFLIFFCVFVLSYFWAYYWLCAHSLERLLLYFFFLNMRTMNLGMQQNVHCSKQQNEASPI